MWYYLIKELEEQVRQYGEQPLTTLWLLNILKKAAERKRGAAAWAETAAMFDSMNG